MTHEPRDAGVLLQEFLSGRDVPCPACRYNLRNTTASRCAECGLVLELALTQRPRLGPLACIIASIAAPIGFAATVSLTGWYRVYERFRDPVPRVRYYGWGRADWINLWLSTGVFLAGLLLLRIVVWVSGRFLGWRRRTQWLLALVAIILSAGTIVGMLMLYARIYLLNES